jgi:Domain of Unknown Function (DUF928)
LSRWLLALLLGTPLGTDAPAAQPGAPPQLGGGTEETRSAPLTAEPFEGKKASQVSTPTYIPPKRGAPGGRVGGGTRGTDQTFTLSVLAPDHTGLTAEAQPTLYWYLSRSISTPMEFALIKDGVTKPLVEKVMTPPFEAGVQRLRLTDFGVQLESGKRYQWSVILVTNPKRRSKDVLAGATIERVALPEGTASKLAHAERSEAVRLYAEAGHWYDAVAVLSELIDGHPTDVALRKQRAALLQQVGLAEIADYDLGQKFAN